MPRRRWAAAAAPFRERRRRGLRLLRQRLNSRTCLDLGAFGTMPASAVCQPSRALQYDHCWNASLIVPGSPAMFLAVFCIMDPLMR